MKKRPSDNSIIYMRGGSSNGSIQSDCPLHILQTEKQEENLRNHPRNEAKQEIVAFLTPNRSR